MAGNKPFTEVLKQRENEVQDTITEQCFPCEILLAKLGLSETIIKQIPVGFPRVTTSSGLAAFLDLDGTMMSSTFAFRHWITA